MSISPESVFVTGGDGTRRRGRRRAAEPGSTLSVWVFEKHHDRLAQIAKQKGMSVSEVARTLLEKAMRL